MNMQAKFFNEDSFFKRNEYFLSKNMLTEQLGFNFLCVYPFVPFDLMYIISCMLHNDNVDVLPGNWLYLSVLPYTILKFTMSNLIDIMIKMEGINWRQEDELRTFTISSVHFYACLVIILIYNIYVHLQNKYLSPIPGTLLRILAALYNLAKLVLITAATLQDWPFFFF